MSNFICSSSFGSFGQTGKFAGRRCNRRCERNEALRTNRIWSKGRVEYTSLAENSVFSVTSLPQQVVGRGVAKKPRFLNQSISIYAYTYILSCRRRNLRNQRLNFLCFFAAILKNSVNQCKSYEAEPCQSYEAEPCQWLSK